MSRAHHLQEERLFEGYLTVRGGEPMDPPLAEHLADCPACAARYAELASFMDGLRRESETEADAVFTPERLRQQHQQIERRVALAGRSARVISFPERGVHARIGARLGASATRTASRWALAAAAAGLFVGVALGASYELRAHGTTASRLAESARPRLAPVGTRGTAAADVASDDAFLSDLEAALERPHTRELQAFDAFTPHVREVRDQH
jgi:anti-sigma factor RsiW